MPDKSLSSRTDVLILGGGVIGLSIARELHQLGSREITIVERGTCGRGATWAAAGMLSPQAETDEIGPFFDLCSRSLDLYPEFAQRLLDETGIDVEFDRTGTLCLAFNEHEVDELNHRYEWQRRAGLAVERLSGNEISEIEPDLSPNIELGLRFPNDWQVENRKLASALRKYSEINGIRIIENIGAEALVVDNDSIAGAVTSLGTIRAETTIVATGAWTSLIRLAGKPMPVEVEPVRGQMVCLTAATGRPLRHVVYTHRGYLVPRRDGRILSGSTSERVGFDASTTETATKALTHLASDLLPNREMTVTDSWAGLRPFAKDGLPVIGGIDGLESFIIATGHYRNGILLTPITAKLIAEKVVNGRDDDVFSTFGPQRLARVAAVS